MLNMCIPIPSRLPPDLIPSSETLITPSCNDSLLFPSPSAQGSPAGAPDRSFLDTEGEGQTEKQSGELKQDPDDCDVQMVLEDQYSNGDRSAFAVESQGQKEEEVSELKQESDDRHVEMVLEEQDFNAGGVKVLEEQEFRGGGEKVLEESGHQAAGEANNVPGEVAGGPGVCGNQVEGDDGEASPYLSPFRSRFLRKYSKPVARQTRVDPFSSRYSSDYDKLGLRSSSDDFDEDYSDTGLHMQALSSRPPPPPPPPVGAGLGNMGNTCFLNAVMQCFTHTVPLVLGLKFYDCGFPTHHNDGEFCVLSAVRDHVSHALASPGEVIFPENLVNNLSYVSSFFQRFQQEDAHEYLQCLLDKTDTCWSKCKVDGKGASSQGDSLVKQVFGGRLVSQLHCCKCGSRSDTYEPLVDLSLEIEDADDLNGALKSFTKMEENEDEVKFKCEKCKEQVPLKKQLLIDQAPSVATLHLKRFKGDGYFVEKIDKALDYPLELDLKPYTVVAEDENVDLRYELYAVIVHMGFSSTSGHYLCYIRSSPGRWFRIDDSKVTEVREEVALSQQGYILFYAKKGTPWPCSIVKSSCDNGILSTSPKSVLDSLEYTQHSNPQKECFYNPNAVERCAVMEMEASTEPKIPFPQAFDGTYRNTDEVASNEPSTVPKKEVINEELIAAGNIQHSNPQKACLYNQGAVEGSTVMETEASTEPELPFQQIFDETCRNTDDVASNEPSKNGVSSEELIAAGNSSLSGVPKDDAKIICRMDALDPMLTNDFSKKSTDDMLVNKTKSSIPTLGVSNEHKVFGLNGSANFSHPSKSRSSSPDVYSVYNFPQHPEAAAYPQPLKKMKVEKSVTPRKANRSKTISDRKRREAMRSIQRLPSGLRRRQLLTGALFGLKKEGSMSKNRKRL